MKIFGYAVLNLGALIKLATVAAVLLTLCYTSWRFGRPRYVAERGGIGWLTLCVCALVLSTVLAVAERLDQ